MGLLMCSLFMSPRRSHLLSSAPRTAPSISILYDESEEASANHLLQSFRALRS